MRRTSIIVFLLAGALFLGVAIPFSGLAHYLASLTSWGASPQGPLASPDQGGHHREPAKSELRAAVGSMISPSQTYLAYRRLFELVAKKMDRRLVFFQRQTYSEVNDLIAGGQVDLAWVCTGAAKDLLDRHGAKVIAVPEVKGRSTYRSYLIVRKDSDVRDIGDLRGKTFAFTDPLSLTGYHVVRNWLDERGEKVDTFFSTTFFTHGHDNSIVAVKRRLAWGATVDSLIFDYLHEYSPATVEGVKIAWMSPEYPIPPLVISAKADEGLQQGVLSAILELNGDPTARKVLEEIGIDRIVPADSRPYLMPIPGREVPVGLAHE